MSRSRKKYCGHWITCVETSKPDKKRSNKRFRRICRQLLYSTINYKDVNDDYLFPVYKKWVNMWDWDCDGRWYWAPNDIDFNDIDEVECVIKLMRK